MDRLAPVYSPKEYETKWSQFWEDKKLFVGRLDSKAPSYVILMPPPNVTSKLHMGHGMGDTIQDILVRWRRMVGDNACYLPGTDHAGIATQMMVEKAVEAEGTTRQKMGRKAFEERLWKWKDENGRTIVDQLRRLGLSCDWSREAFTMDDDLSAAVRHIFVQLYQDGLIYRGERLVNWDPALKTAVSDDEVYNEEVSGSLWYFNYPLADGSGVIGIATTRPETMLGDTAVAVNPDDERYQHMIGKKVKLPLTGREIPIIADSYVKPEFGTGAVKITPAHDPNDFEIGKRHNLQFLNIMEVDGSMNQSVPAEFRGLDRFVARKAVIKAMKALELFVKEEGVKHSLPHSDRSKAIIEPRLSLQWFVKMAELAKPAADAAKSGELRFFPDNWKKTYLHWLDNIQDWCISRQLWWGHRIPIWFCADCSATTTGMTDPTKCAKCGSAKITQDEDVLDTWFSSWLWPLSPFGWPEKTKDLETFYPSAVLVTAPEIIFLWVARMVMVGLRTTGKIPFRDVYLTATVCDKQGRKFSKTLGNGIDPLEIIDKHGTDATRFTAVYLAPLGGRVRMSATDFELGAKFVNKIWNAARFVLKYIPEGEKLQPIDDSRLNLAQQWLLSRFNQTAGEVNECFTNYRINEGVEKLYHFVWNEFCDWGLESAKISFESPERTPTELSVLIYVLDGILRLLSPITPFVTEEIWQKLPPHPQWERPVSLVIAKYPDKQDKAQYDRAAEQWQLIQDVVGGIRSLRSQYNLPPKDGVKIVVKSAQHALLEQNRVTIERLGTTSSLTIGESVTKPEASLVQVGKGYEVYLDAKGLVDFEQEKKRIKTEIERIEKILKGIDAKLGNADFRARAPAEVIQQNEEQKANMTSQMTTLRANLVSLGG